MIQLHDPALGQLDGIWVEAEESGRAEAIRFILNLVKTQRLWIPPAPQPPGYTHAVEQQDRGIVLVRHRMY